MRIPVYRSQTQLSDRAPGARITARNGKLHGVWKSYDNDGKKLSIGTYENGRKVGKWLFWNGDSLKEVEFIDSKIMSVNKWNNKTKVAIRDK